MIGELQLTSQPMPHGAAARQPYLQALLERDPAVLVDGGDLLPLGQEEMLRNCPGGRRRIAKVSSGF